MKYRITKIERQYSDSTIKTSYVIERSLLGLFWSPVKYPKLLDFNTQTNNIIYEFASLQEAEDVLWVFNNNNKYLDVNIRVVIYISNIEFRGHEGHWCYKNLQGLKKHIEEIDEYRKTRKPIKETKTILIKESKSKV